MFESVTAWIVDVLFCFVTILPIFYFFCNFFITYTNKRFIQTNPFGSHLHVQFTITFSVHITFFCSHVNKYSVIITHLSLWWTIPTKSIVSSTSMALCSTKPFQFPALATFLHQANFHTLAIAEFPPWSTICFPSLYFGHNYIFDTLIVNSYWLSIELWTWVIFGLHQKSLAKLHPAKRVCDKLGLIFCSD